MNSKTLEALLKLLAAASYVGVEAAIIANAYAAIKRETQMTDEQLFAETERIAGELDAKILKRLAEMEAQPPSLATGAQQPIVPFVEESE